MYSFDRQTTLSRSARDINPTKASLSRSKTPGPEFEKTKSSSYRANTMKPRSKTPTAYELSSNTLHNRFEKKIIHTNFSYLYFFLLVDHYNLFIHNIQN
jgi:hypothetical protein